MEYVTVDLAKVYLNLNC